MKRTDCRSRLQTIALSLSPNIGAVTFQNLLNCFDHNLDAILAASPKELMRAPGVGKIIASEIAAIDLDALARELRAASEQGVEILLRGDRDYPAPLSDVADAPLAIFASRALRPADWQAAVAIVGTREPSDEARFIALELAMKLARAGRAVVSGLALGVDAAAHSGALSADGLTVAVLGSGILNVYPEANSSLAERIRERGALISEVHPGWSAKAQRLVSRNRIISGLSRAVIVVEAAEDGGAMHTARFASEQGQPVFTFDLPASGNQRLIQAGAGVLRRDDPLLDLPAGQNEL
ncbi:MAG: DNA-processing protein DprA [Chloroflexi bacterium]|nr:DNA-processing protein DprA [Chloroflexota bacterium]